MLNSISSGCYPLFNTRYIRHMTMFPRKDSAALLTQALNALDMGLSFANTPEGRHYWQSVIKKLTEYSRHARAGTLPSGANRTSNDPYSVGASTLLHDASTPAPSPVSNGKISVIEPAVIHVFHKGDVLCRTNGIYGKPVTDWPVNHVRVDLGDRVHATCNPCVAAALALVKTQP